MRPQAGAVLTSISHKLFHVIGIILYFFEPYFLIYIRNGLSNNFD